MGYPHDGPSDKKRFLNDMHQLSTYLNEYHSEHFLVWNISDGTQVSAAVTKKLAEKLGFQLLNVPWDAREGTAASSSIGKSKCPTPPLCYSIQGWLDLNPENVAAVTCRSEPRTSVLVACYLRYARDVSNHWQPYGSSSHTQERLSCVQYKRSQCSDQQLQLILEQLQQCR
jgi:hypothetical protein